VENIVAALPGRDSTGRIFLVAHYDSTFGTPGAADDKAAVAAVVETVRALSTGVQLRNDVVVLLTDGEEPGLLGAAAFRCCPAEPTSHRRRTELGSDR
jgi:Zn-dependent M28 family amino/carboxypeptidase